LSIEQRQNRLQLNSWTEFGRLSRELSKFCLTVLFIDGVHFDEHVVLAG
jgi:hypothetical protein